MVVDGWPVTVLSRGEVVIEDQKLLVQAGRGEFLPCGKPDMARPKVA
jgi:dihydropyrimidinase